MTKHASTRVLLLLALGPIKACIQSFREIIKTDENSTLIPVKCPKYDNPELRQHRDIWFHSHLKKIVCLLLSASLCINYAVVNRT